MDRTYNYGERTIKSSVGVKDEVVRATIDEEDFEYEVVKLAEGDFILRSSDGSQRRCLVSAAGQDRFVYVDGRIHHLTIESSLRRGKAEEKGSLKAPMPGKVLKVLVTAGQKVVKGEPLVILEAMKMQHEIVAPADGSVTAVNKSEGANAQQGEVLVTLEEQIDA
ncbi:MAG: biotin/lipoyl-binding protein [Planctomycetes bacterium]|nr:biotin/lipoyl-binding protein [Planctomycetota bacterium]